VDETVHTANLYLPPKTIGRVLQETLSEKQDAYLALVVRTNVFSRDDSFKKLKASVDNLLRRKDARRFVFSPPMQAARMLS